jgi:hypothetical protein
MPESPRKPALSVGHRRALQLLASSDGAWPEALFLARGFSAKLVETLVAAGLVAVATVKTRAGGSVVPVRRLRITEAGRLIIGS